VATDTIAVAQNLALTIFQYRVENTVKLARHRLEVNTLVGTAVITRLSRKTLTVVLVLLILVSINALRV
jgi:hypothetical protein